MQKEVCNHEVCRECGHMYQKGTGKDVQYNDNLSLYRSSEVLHYCKACAPKYDTVRFIGYREFFYKTVQVSKEGIPIGYTEIKEPIKEEV